MSSRIQIFKIKIVIVSRIILMTACLVFRNLDFFLNLHLMSVSKNIKLNRFFNCVASEITVESS